MSKEKEDLEIERVKKIVPILGVELRAFVDEWLQKYGSDAIEVVCMSQTLIRGACALKLLDPTHSSFDLLRVLLDKEIKGFENLTHEDQDE